MRHLIAVAFSIAFSMLGTPGSAQNSIAVSQDISLELDGATFADESVAVDNLLGVTVPVALGSLPENAAVTAYSNLGGGDQLFALDTTAELAGSVVVYPADVVRYSGGIYTIEFDSAAEGIPAGVRIDAVSASGSDLLLSFDTTVDLGGVFVADEDVVQWDGSSFSVALDASAAGIPAALDLDAVDDAGGGFLWVSFDGHGTVDGQSFADEDVVLLDPSGPSLTVVYDASSEDPNWVAADVEAAHLPEPSALVGLLSSASLLSLLRRRARVMA